MAHQILAFIIGIYFAAVAYGAPAPALTPAPAVVCPEVISLTDPFDIVCTPLSGTQLTSLKTETRYNLQGAKDIMRSIRDVINSHPDYLCLNEVSILY